jgi:hypothetical protein
MERGGYIRTVLHEISTQHAQHTLMRNDTQITHFPLHLQHHRPKPIRQIMVRLCPWIPMMIRISFPPSRLLGPSREDFLVCQAIAVPRVELHQFRTCRPFYTIGEIGCSLSRTKTRRSPDLPTVSTTHSLPEWEWGEEQ